MPISRQSGFSLAEVLLALGLLGGAGITIVGLWTVLTNSNVQARDDVRAHATAVAVMESLLTREYDELAVGSLAGVDADGIAWNLDIRDAATSLREIEVTAGNDDTSARLSTLISDRF